MNCPNCDHQPFSPADPCPVCRFSGDPALLEELAHLDWLLDEMESWPAAGLTKQARRKLYDTYLARLRQIEITLKLRLPPLSKKEAKEAWPGFIHRERLQARVSDWLQNGSLKQEPAQQLLNRLEDQLEDLREQLEGHRRPNYPATRADLLALTNFLLEAVAYLTENDAFTSPEAKAAVVNPLLAEQSVLEKRPGLRASPEAKPSPKPPPEPASPSPQPPPPKAPPVPFRERFWRSLLSEQTLQVILFLGIFLLFAAALSFVAWGWRSFPPWMRVAIPTGFTALFFALGRYMRGKTNLRRSGVALSAIAALLIPIDFYTLYDNLQLPPNVAPYFWLAASLGCLAAYAIATAIIRSRFFGYLVVAAAGSAVLAAVQIGHQTANLSLDWRTAGLSALALALMALATALEQKEQTAARRAFVEPFRYMALLAVGVLMPFTFAWRYLDRPGIDSLHYAMTANWWLGAVVFGWGAVIRRSRSLGTLAALSLPAAVYFTQVAVFAAHDIRPAWHAFGLAWLTPVYLLAGHALLRRRDDPVLYGHGQTAVRWSVGVLVASALWSLTDLSSSSAAASSHAVLAGSAVLAAWLFKRPRLLYGASLFALTTTTFALTELGLAFWQLAPAWSALALIHIFAALGLGRTPAAPARNYAPPLVAAGFGIAGLALLPPLFPYDGQLLAYALGNWLGMSAWGAWLARRMRPGFTPRFGGGQTLFHWLATLPLPVWVGVLFANARPLDFSYALALSALGWGMVGLSYHLQTLPRSRGIGWPWTITGLLAGLAAPATAGVVAPAGVAPAGRLRARGRLFLFDAFASRRRWFLAVGGVMVAWGYGLLLHRLNLSASAVSFGLAGLAGVYVLAGLWTERQRSAIFNARFVAFLYPVAHGLALLVLARIYRLPLEALFTTSIWTDAMQVWGAAAQLWLGVVYGLYAWGRYSERWGHLAAWLGAAAGGFAAVAFSRGHGSSAAKGALVAAAYVLAERGVRHLWRGGGQPGRRRFRAAARLAWRLYRRPLLATGWIVSAGVIGLALVRNLWLLGGGPIQRFWAWLGLLILVGLYALSAWLFRRARFVWLAAGLVFAPWTILTSVGWYTPWRPTAPGYALGWVALAGALFGLHLVLHRRAGPGYALPAQAVAQVLLPFSLLWGVADVETSRFTVGLAIALYAAAAYVARREKLSSKPNVSRFHLTKFMYPALGLVPVWGVYLMAWLLPPARHEHYGLLLLLFGPAGMAAGGLLKRLGRSAQEADAYALPGYLTGYGALIVGTMLVAHMPALLACALLFDALIFVASARLFKNPLWVYPAAVLVPVSLLTALSERGISADRRGWWLIGLAAIYMAPAWALRRVKLPAYGAAALAVGFALLALGLPPSSRDRVGAFWGYGGAAVLYGLTAIWLKQPLLLVPACALIVVPYAAGLQLSTLEPPYYGPALFPGGLLALALGQWLDGRFGARRDFPWHTPLRWGVALADRLLNWWGLPLYALGFGLSAAAPFFTAGEASLAALNFALLVPIFGWGVYRFRLRGWLLAAGVAGHLAAVYGLSALGWWRYPPYAWLRFLAVTWLTAGAAVYIERRLDEGSPLETGRRRAGWSRPLYLLVGLDVVVAQLFSLTATAPGALVTLNHAALTALLATLWGSRRLPYGSTILGALALVQWMSWHGGSGKNAPALLALLSLGYGAAGYGLTLLKRRLPPDRQPKPGAAVWEIPLQRSGLALSFGVLALTAALGLDVAGWTVRALFGFPFREIVEVETVRMVIRVFSVLGLLYLAAAFIRRYLRLAYAAVAMLLLAWVLYAFYVQVWAGLARAQWYAVPAGLYLLGVGYLEWGQGRKTVARWIDYAAMLLMLGSLFWQTLVFGWAYFWMLLLEGLLAVWWGSARRLRRFLYAGMVAIILGTVGQLINAALQLINQWLVFGLIGLLLVLAAVLVERKLEDLKAWQDSLELWE
ncbi:MAG: hypothetical protein ACE5G8_00445 [Anaerolineae bacterium]